MWLSDFHQFLYILIKAAYITILEGSNFHEAKATFCKVSVIFYTQLIKSASIDPAGAPTTFLLYRTGIYPQYFEYTLKE